MPVVNFHLVQGSYTSDQALDLLTRASELYAAELGAPVDRIRAFITPHAPHEFFAGAKPCLTQETQAPFFECIVMEGRTVEQRHSLLAGFTDLIVVILGAEKARVRGCCWRVPAEDWAIAGVPASTARADEIRVRQAGQIQQQ